MRLELARAYYLNSDFEQARREFLIVLSSDLPKPARQAIGGRSLVGVSVFAEAVDGRADHTGYGDVALTVFGSSEIAGGFPVATAGFVRRYEADGAAPFMSDARRETEFGFDLDVMKNDVLLWGRYSPDVAIGVSRRNSSIDAYSFTERRVFVGIRRSL